MEVEYIWAAHSIPLSLLNRLLPIMPLKSEFLAPASRSKVPRASIGARSRKNAIFLNQRSEILEEENVCPHIHEQFWVKKCAFFEPEVGKRVICDVKFAYRKNL